MPVFLHGLILKWPIIHPDVESKQRGDPLEHGPQIDFLKFLWVPMTCDDSVLCLHVHANIYQDDVRSKTPEGKHEEL